MPLDSPRMVAALSFLAWPRSARIPLRGRHIFITGWSSGIGLALATFAAREGARVSSLARNVPAPPSGPPRSTTSGSTRPTSGMPPPWRPRSRTLCQLKCSSATMESQVEEQDMEEVKWMVDINLKDIADFGQETMSQKMNLRLRVMLISLLDSGAARDLPRLQ